ncbi:hypothetical protein ABPG74_022432 [Tetrahymena malaccensis]
MTDRVLPIQTFFESSSSVLVKQMAYPLEEEEKEKLEGILYQLNFGYQNNFNDVMLYDNLEQVQQDVVKVQVRSTHKIRLAKVIKQQVRKGSNIEFNQLIKILKTIDDSKVKSEIIFALGYKINQLREQVENNIIEYIKKLIHEKDIQPEAKNFLNYLIQKRFKIINDDYQKIRDGNIKVSTNYSQKRPALIVSKTQQKIKVSYKNKQSEEETIKIQSLAEALKNRKRKILSKAEQLPPIIQKGGNDRVFTSGTYQEVKNLYERAKNGQVIKNDDKDNYLPNKFIGPQVKYFSGSILQSFFTDIMISETFLIISNRQLLNNKAIDKLMECIGSVNDIMKKFLKISNFEKDIDKSIMKKVAKQDYQNEPKIIADIANNIYQDCLRDIHFYLIGWNCVLDKNKFFQIILSQILKIRLNSAQAIYNCAIRNKGILNQKILESLQTFLRDQDFKFRGQIIKILCLTDNEHINYKNLFSQNLSELENNINTETAAAYIINQIKISSRRNELFDNQTMLRLCKLLQSDCLSYETKIQCSEIINNYLEYTFTQGLNQEQLKICQDVIENKNTINVLKSEVLKSILLTAENTKYLPKQIVNSLVNIIDSLDEKTACFIVITLGNICESTPVINLDKLCSKLLDDQVVVREKCDITLEQRSKNNIGYPSISSIVSEIFVKSIQKLQKIQFTENGINNLLSALNSFDKQTRIQTAKALSIIVSHNVISESHLSVIMGHTQDQIADIQIYTTIAYTQAINKMVQSNISIQPSYFEYLFKMYAFQNLRLGELDFTEQVNNNILQVLLYQSDKQIFDESVFNIFEHIFLLEYAGDQKQRIAIQILDKYTSMKNLIPTNIIAALEEKYDQTELCNIALKILKNIIQNGQRVSEKTLCIFCDRFYVAEDVLERFESLYLLDTANYNYELPDEVFDKLEMQRSSFAILCNFIGKKQAITYLMVKTDEGKYIPIDGLKALASNLTNQSYLSILSNVSKNQQTIPDYIIDNLVLEFNPLKSQTQIIEIFTNIAKNNQNIPDKLLVKLEQALDNNSISQQVLSIFAIQGQKGENLTTNVVKKIFNTFLNIDNIQVKQELLSTINSIIEQNQFDNHLIKKVLIHGISQENENIIQSSINGFRSFSKYVKLDDECINALVTKAAKANSNEIIKENILSILKICELNIVYKNKLGLANFSDQNSTKVLEKMSKLSKNSPLLEQNFKQLNSILDNEPDLQSKVINILIECINKQDISDELMNSIAILCASTISNEIKKLCYNLINKIAETGRKLCDKFIKLLLTEESRELVQNTLQLVSKNEYISFQTSLLIRIDNIKPTTCNKYLNELLKNIHEELSNGFELTDFIIQKLIMIQTLKQENEEYSNLDDISNIFIYILNKQPKYHSNKIIVSAIEQKILSKNVTLNIVNIYQNIIRQRSYLNIDDVTNKMADLLIEGNQIQKLNISMLLCISGASEVFKISKKCLKILECNIDNQNENIRSLSVRGLIAAQNYGYNSEIFKLWINSIFAQFKNCINTEVKYDLQLVITLASLKNIDLNSIAQKPQIEWKKELLLSDLLTTLQVNEADKLDFYQNWLDFESNEQFDLGKSEQILMALRNNLNDEKIIFEQLNEIIRFLSQIDFETINNILLNSIEPYTNLKQKWIEKLILKRLHLEVSNIYLEIFALNICNKLSAEIIDKLLNSISVISNLREFELLLDFAQHNQIKTSDIYMQNASINELKRSLEIKILGNQMHSSENRQKLAHIIDNLFDKQWTFEQLNEILSSLKSLNTIGRVSIEKSYITIIEIIDQYKISQTKHQNILNALNHRPDDWLKEINKIAIVSNFQTTGRIQNSTQLVEELKNTNLSNRSIQELIDSDLLNQINKIKSSKLESITNSNQSQFYIILNQIKSSIVEWDQSDIELWSKNVKSNLNYFQNPKFLIEMLAVIKRANFLHTGFHMTDTQILSCLLILHANKNQGRLLQVATGEGKSTIISVIAIINALKGKKVDIITSSPVLAERDAKEKTRLYKMFGLSCADNNDKKVYINGPKNCYYQDIVYGEAAQYQFDTLRDQYSLLGTLANRKNEVAIVDEVDSMLIDDNSKIARLSSTIPGIDQLQPIYCFLWQRLIFLQERILEINGKICFFNGKISYEQDSIVLEYANKKGKLKKIPNLKDYIKHTKDISHIGQIIIDEIEVFLKENLVNYINKLLEDKTIKVPNNFKEFVEKQKYKWIDNTIVALQYQQNVHYIIHEGVIKPVDYNSTGIVQSSTNWCDGLHQFLQIKHALKMTSETFTTNFISNIGYFSRYGSNLYGLTGTLGSNKAKEVLSEIYNVDLINIPSLRQKQYLELSTVVAINENRWLHQICQAALNEVNKERATLIICETIEHTQLIQYKLKSEYRVGESIKLYTMNNMNQEKEIEKVNPGEIIIATNLAGRGTDIKTDSIEKNGGLHVIVTFMPPNQRVEEQAFGRTARQGKCGTGQMILNAASLIDYREYIPQTLKVIRNEIEAKALEKFQKKELNAIKIKDKLFSKLCEFLNFVRQDIRDKREIYQKLSYNVKNVVWSCGNLIQKCMDLQFTCQSTVEANLPIQNTYEINLLSAIEEQWAMFLRKIDDEEIPIHCAEDQYEKFISQIKNDYLNKNVIKNPYYHICIANNLVINDLSKETYNLVMDHYDQAIKLDQNYSPAAFAGKAWLLLKCGGKFFIGNNKSIGYKEQAIIELEKALTIISDEIALINSIQSQLQQNGQNIQSDLSQQLMIKISILGNYANNLQAVIYTIKKSQRLIDIIGIKCFQNQDKYFEKVCNDNSTYEECTDYNMKIQKESTQYCGILRNKEGQIDQKLDIYSEFELVFNDLTVKKDLIDSDQAINTIQAAYEKKNFYSIAILGQDYQNISINLRQINTVRLKQILYNDYKEETKQQEINKLKKELKNLNLNLNIEFQGLDQITAKNKLCEIQSQYFNIEITDHKDCILAAINHSNVNTVGFLKKEKNTTKTEYLYVQEAKKKISEINQNNCHIKLENLQYLEVNKIIEECQNAIFNINFVTINPEENLSRLSEEQVNVSFNKLDSINSQKLIKCLRKENIDFDLVFRHLKKDQVIQIIKKASLDQEDIQINKEKTLNELFMSESKPALELQEFAARGIEYLLEINEKKFIPWLNLLAVGLSATIQLAAGVYMIGTVYGFQIGIGLINEGAADILTVQNIYSTRNFSWEDYVAQKAVSVMASAFCVAMNKQESQTISELTKGLQKRFLEKAGSALPNTSLNQQKQALIKIAIKKTSAVIVQTKVQSILNLAANQLSGFAIQEFKPQILEQIEKKVSYKFFQQNLMDLVRKMYALDLINTNKQISLKEKIDRIIFDTINPENSLFQKAWDSIGLPLCNGIFLNREYLGKKFAMCIRLLGTLKGLHEVTTIIDNVHDILVKKLSQLDEETLQIAQLLKNYCQLELNEAREIVAILKENNIIKIEKQSQIGFYLEQINPQIFKNNKEQKYMILAQVDFKNLNQHKKQVINFCELLHKTAQSIQISDLSQIIKSVSDKITEQIIRVTESKLISPWSSYFISRQTGSIYDSIENKIIQYQLGVEINQLQEQLALLQEIENKTPDDQNKIKDLQNILNKKNIQSQKPQTFTNLIQEQGREFQIQYQQCNIEYHAGQQDQGKDKEKHFTQELKDYIEKVKKDKPADLYDMIALITIYQLDVIIKNKDYQLTEEDIKKGKQYLLNFIKGEKDNQGNDKVGHWTFNNKNGICKAFESQNNDCGYVAIQEILKEKGINVSVQDLRNQVAQYALANPYNFTKAIQAQNWIKTNYPQEANTILYNGSFVQLAATSVLTFSIPTGVIGIIIIAAVAYYLIIEPIEVPKKKIEKKIIPVKDTNLPYISLIPTRQLRIEGFEMKNNNDVYDGNVKVLSSYGKEMFIELLNFGISAYNRDTEESLKRLKNSIISGAKFYICNKVDLSNNLAFDQARYSIDNNALVKIVSKIEECYDTYKEINESIGQIIDDLNQKKSSQLQNNQLEANIKFCLTYQKSDHQYKNQYEEEINNENEQIAEGIKKVAKGEDIILMGLGINNLKTDIGKINSFFGMYTLRALSYILTLRINCLQINKRNIQILNCFFINQLENDIPDLIIKIIQSNQETFIVSLNLYDKHAAGFIFEKVFEKSNQIIKVKYFDPLNKPIPEELKKIIEIILIQKLFSFEQIIVEMQKYSNCGPEVIENFVLYLTGQRVSQENAIALHSRLVQQELTGKINQITYQYF